MTAADPPQQRLQQRYLLAVPVSFARDSEGRVWLDELWWHDLRAHLDYISHLTVLSPCRRIDQPAPGMVEAKAPPGSTLEFVEIFPEGGMRSVLPRLPSALRTGWRTVGQADLVHAGVAGWPIPIGAIVNPIAAMRGKPLIIVIESAFWRLQPGADASRKARLRAGMTERFARWSLRRATLAVYTHAGYRDSLPVGPKGSAVVLPASWIAANDVLSADEAGALWDGKGPQPRFLLASRLLPEKGIPLFLDMLQSLEQRGEEIHCDVIGTGPMRPALEAFADSARSVRLRVLDPMPYGPDFLRFLGSYHATLVPLTGDEQARILYDSFSQAVPVIASDTPGNREVVTDGKTGFLFPADSAEAFANALIAAARQPDALRQAGLDALTVASGHTHQDMHAKRAALLFRLFGTG